MIVRSAQPDDAIPSELLQGFATADIRFNRDQMLVAVEDDGSLVGLAILYDGGHETLFLEHFVVHPLTRGRRVAECLMSGCVEYGRQRGARMLFGFSPNAKFVRRAQRAGATCMPRPFALLAWDLTRGDPAYRSRKEPSHATV